MDSWEILELGKLLAHVDIISNQVNITVQLKSSLASIRNTITYIIERNNKLGRHKKVNQ